MVSVWCARALIYRDARGRACGLSARGVAPPLLHPEIAVRRSSLILDEWAGDDGLPATVGKDAATGMHEGRGARVIPGELKEPGLGESVDDAADPGPVDGTRARRARLARRVARVARKVVVPDVRDARRTRLVSAWLVTSFSVVTLFSASSTMAPLGATRTAPNGWLPWSRAACDTAIARRRYSRSDCGDIDSTPRGCVSDVAAENVRKNAWPGASASACTLASTVSVAHGNTWSSPRIGRDPRTAEVRHTAACGTHSSACEERTIIPQVEACSTAWDGGSLDRAARTT